MTPLEIAEILLRSTSTRLPRDLNGAWIADGTEPPTLLTTAMYESGLKVLDLREKAQRR